MKRVTVLILRRRESYNYMRDPAAAPAWGNNDVNNMLDQYLVFIDGVEVFRCPVQTVANHPEARFRDTIAPGRFGILLDVDKRLFSGQINGIVGARDLEGDYVDFESVQLDDLSRWLEHDRRRLKDTPADQDLSMTALTRVAWSAGCIVHNPEDLVRVNHVFTEAGLPSGYVIASELVVV